MRNVKLADYELPRLDPQRGQRSFALADDRDLEFHALADLFPLIEGEAFTKLVADVKENGVREPIWIYDGKILDGRNRYRAGRAAGVPLRFKLYQGDDPVKFVVSLNFNRRHLTEAQRAMVAAKLANMRQGHNEQPANLPVADASAAQVSQARAAKLLNVSERSVRSAVKVREKGAAELQHAVETGIASIAAAEAVAELSPEEQARVVAAGEKAILDKAAEIRKRKAEDRRRERIERIKVDATAAAPGAAPCLYPVIYADPPWRYENPPMGDSDRSIENHYRTMPLAEIAALPVADWATGAAVLFLWCTVPQQFHVVPPLMTAWGFAVKSEIVWDKETISLGKWTRNRHEKLFVCARGDMPPPLPAMVPESLFRERAGEHSVKPDRMRKMIAAMYPDLPRLEMFARGLGQRDLGGGFYTAADGWHVWGDEAQAPALRAGELPLVTQDELDECRALDAINGGVTIAGPIVGELRTRRLVARDALTLTVDGCRRLAQLAARVDAASAADGGVRVVKKSQEQAAAASVGGDGDADDLDIPEFLRWTKDERGVAPARASEDVA